MKKNNSFPRKEFYACTFDSPVNAVNASAIDSCGKITHSNFLRNYAEAKWDVENKGWKSSMIPTALDVHYTEDKLLINCGVTEYKYLLGQFKLALEKNETNLFESIHGLSTEILPLSLDEIFLLQRRTDGITQHGVDFYDIPTAGQHAGMYLNQASEKYPGLVKGMLDMDGFPRFNLARHLNLKPEEIGSIDYVGFSRGFEVSLDSQFNGVTKLNLENMQLIKRAENPGLLLAYRFADILDVFDSLGKKGKNVKEDLFKNKPVANSLTKGFGIIDDCLGTFLSVLFHKNVVLYTQALGILANRGYKVNNKYLSSGKVIKLDDLN